MLGTTWHLDPDYSTNPGRVTRRDVLIPLIAAETGRHTKADLLARLGAVNVPVGPINDLAEVFSDPQVVHRGMRLDLPDPRAKGGTIPSVRSPIVIDGVPMAARTASPQVGTIRRACWPIRPGAGDADRFQGKPITRKSFLSPP